MDIESPRQDVKAWTMFGVLQDLQLHHVLLCRDAPPNTFTLPGFFEDEAVDPPGTDGDAGLIRGGRLC